MKYNTGDSSRQIRLLFEYPMKKYLKDKEVLHGLLALLGLALFIFFLLPMASSEELPVATDYTQTLLEADNPKVGPQDKSDKTDTTGTDRSATESDTDTARRRVDVDNGSDESASSTDNESASTTGTDNTDNHTSDNTNDNTNDMVKHPWSPYEYKLVTVKIIRNGDDEPLLVKAELADTLDKQTYGLKNRSAMDESEGMLFVFPEEVEYAFIMEDMQIPLDIIFIDKDGYIVSIIENMTPCAGSGDKCPLYRSSAPYLRVLEVNAGYVKRHGIDVGDKVRVLD